MCSDVLSVEASTGGGKGSRSGAPEREGANRYVVVCCLPYTSCDVKQKKERQAAAMLLSIGKRCELLDYGLLELE